MVYFSCWQSPVHANGVRNTEVAKCGGQMYLGFPFTSVKPCLKISTPVKPCLNRLKIITTAEISTSFHWSPRNLPAPPNVIYSRFWYAFSLFLRKFHSVKPFNGNFCEPGRARFTEKKMEFPSQDVSKRYFILFSAKFEPLSNPFRGCARWTCGMNLFMTWLV